MFLYSSKYRRNPLIWINWDHGIPDKNSDKEEHPLLDHLANVKTVCLPPNTTEKVKPSKNSFGY